ncbi:MAG: ABC transporter permease [Patescibacteria group bacterium]|jgi:putative ABC transport system permease protein
MKTEDIFQETFSALLANKVRSGLTILGIVIGIASVIAMVAIGQGASSNIQSSIEGLGSNLLTVSPGAAQAGSGFVSSGRGGAQTLKNGDAEALRDLDGVAAVSPEYQSRFQIVAPGYNTNSTVIGATAGYAEVRNVTIDRGSFLTSSHESAISKVAVVGPTAAVDLFGEGVDPVGKTIRIKGVNFKVIGILKAIGGSGFFNPDEAVLVPLSTMHKILAGVEHLSNISIKVITKEQMSLVQERATALLLSRHKVVEADFSVVSQADILGALTSVTNTFTFFLASIAGISLLVGGIGIMNMMLTAVTERTREIGLRKAIGARKRDISTQFLIEAIMLTFFGGAVGVILGSLTASLVTRFSGIATTISLQSVLLAFGVSAFIGILFGYYPAARAAGLRPIEALRYE